MTPTIGSFCTGYGGLDEAVQQVIGGRLAWVSDIDPGASKILAHRHPDVPNIGDLTTTEWADVEPVDIALGGYPCQPFSTAGKRKGTADVRHIWPHIARALGVLRPRVAIFENVAGHLGLGFDTVLADLARLGFDAEWCVVRADEVGAAHQRKRLFILATATDARGQQPERWGVGGVLGGQAAAEPSEGDQRERAGDAAWHSRETAADAPHLGHHWAGAARPGGHGPADRGDTATDAHSSELAREPQERARRAAVARRGDGPSAHAERVVPRDDRELPAGRDALRQRVRDDAPRRGAAPTADTDSIGRGSSEPDLRPGQPDADWGRFTPAIHRWAGVLGRRAPWATDDRNRLSPAFVEWLMGLPAGHVTDVPGLTRTAQLKALGNGVVPQQAEAAIRLLLARVTTETAVAS